MKSSITTTWHNRLKAIWWKRIHPLWQEYQWPVVGILGLASIGLGYIGFSKYFVALGEIRSGWDILYLSLQLLTLESGSIHGPVSWELEVARLLAPALVAYTAIKALVAIFHEQLQLFCVRFIRDHVVICGLGRKGLLLARAFHDHGYRVVVIEQERENSKLESCREMGATLLIGNATDMELLRKARVQRAIYLFSVCGNDGVNAEVAVHAQDLTANRKGKPLTCFIHIADLELKNLLREKEIAAQKVDSFRLELFNVFESGARALLNEHPAFSPAGGVEGNRAHILVVGMGRMGNSLVVQAARIWRLIHSAGGERLRITIIDRLAEQKKESLCLSYPQLDRICDIVPHNMDIQSPQFQRAEFLFDPGGKCDLSAIYVCMDNDERALSAALVMHQRLREYDPYPYRPLSFLSPALAMHQRLRGDRIPIVVRMTRDAGLAALLRGEEATGSEGFGNLHAFGLLDRTCRLDLLFGGTHEVLARAIHEDYVFNQKTIGQTPRTNPSMASWDELPEGLKESNRRQADHIGIKLKAIGCGIASLNDWDAKLLTFKPEEVEQMARMEHEHWNEERRLEGWTYAPEPKDLNRKTTPYLVPWNELLEDIKEYDRNTIRGLPAFLAQAGFQIYRLKK